MKRQISRGFLIGPLLSEGQNIKMFSPTVYLPDGRPCKLLVYHYGPLVLVMLAEELPPLPSLLKFINKQIPGLFYNFTQMLARMFLN